MGQRSNRLLTLVAACVAGFAVFAAVAVADTFIGDDGPDNFTGSSENDRFITCLLYTSPSPRDRS